MIENGSCAFIATHDKRNLISNVSLNNDRQLGRDVLAGDPTSTNNKNRSRQNSLKNESTACI